jgi:TolC family type I secretion outer membrane protein
MKSICTIAFLIICLRISAQDSLTVNQAVSRALEHHPALRQAEAQVSAARYQIGIARSGFLPAFDAVASYARIEPPFGNIQMFPSNLYNFHISYNQRIFDFGRTLSNVRVAAASSRIAESDLRIEKSDIAYQTIMVFYSILFLQDQETVYDELIAILQSHLAQARIRLGTGSATDFDTLTASVRIADMEIRRISVVDQLTKQKAQLCGMIGAPCDSSMRASGHFSESKEIPNSDSMVDLGLRQVPEVQAARQAQTLSSLTYRAAKLERYPLLGASALYGFQNGYIPNTNQLKANWQAGAQLTLPIFSGFRVTNTINQAAEQYQAAQARTRDVERRITTSIEQTISDIRADIERVAGADLQVAQAQEAVSIAQTRYTLGSVTNLDVLDASASLADAKVNALQARFELQLARFALRKAVGEQAW